MNERVPPRLGRVMHARLPSMREGEMNIASQGRRAAIALIAVLSLAAAASAQADKLNATNMTQKDFNDITGVDSSQAGQPPVEVAPVHDLPEGGAADAKDQGATKVVKGKDWKKMSPKDRDKFLRDLQKQLKANTVFVVEVPSGNVWAMDGVALENLYEEMVLEPWTKEQIEKLPKAVKTNSGNGQDDRRTGDPSRVDVDF